MATSTVGPDFSASVVLSTLVGYLGADAWRPTDLGFLLWPERLLRYHVSAERSFVCHVRFAAAAAPGLPCHKALMSLIEELWHGGYARGGGYGSGLIGTPVFPSSEHIGIFSGVLKPGHCETVPEESPPPPPTTDTRRVNLRASALFALAMEIVEGHWGKSWVTHTPSTSTEPFRRLSHSVSIKLTILRGDPRRSSSALPQPSISYKLTGMASLAFLPILAILIAVAVSRRLLPLCWLYGPSVAGACMLFAPEREAVRLCETCLNGPETTASVKECFLDVVLPKNHGVLRITGPRCVISQTYIHAGEPVRYLPHRRRGAQEGGSDCLDARSTRPPPSETISFLLLIVSLLSFPSGLISLVWLPSSVRWVWLGWQVIGTSLQYMVRERSYKGAALCSGLQQLPRQPSHFIMPTTDATAYVQCEVDWKTYEHILELMDAVQNDVRGFPMLAESWT